MVRCTQTVGDVSCLIVTESVQSYDTVLDRTVGRTVLNFSYDNLGIGFLLQRVGAGEHLTPNEVLRHSFPGRILQLREKLDCLKAAATQAEVLTAGAILAEKFAAIRNGLTVWKTSLKALTNIYSEAKVFVAVR